MSTATTFANPVRARQSFVRALDRAQAQGITVAATGTVTATDEAFFIVTGSRPDTLYTVAEVAGHLTCSCPAGENGLLCKHVAAALHHVEMQRAARELVAASNARLAALEAVRAERMRNPRLIFK